MLVSMPTYRKPSKPGTGQTLKFTLPLAPSDCKSNNGLDTRCEGDEQIYDCLEQIKQCGLVCGAGNLCQRDLRLDIAVMFR